MSAPSRAGRHRSALLLAASLAAGCSVAAVDYTGKQCSTSAPCPEPLVCDASGHCAARGGAGGGGGGSASGGGTGVSAAFAVGTFTSTSGDQVVPHDLGHAPAALLLWTAALPGDGHADESKLSFGVSDGVTSRVVASTDSAASNKTRALHEVDDAVVLWLDATGAVEARATLLSWSPTSFTLRWTKAPATAVRLQFTALGGDAVRATLLPWSTPTTAGPVTVSGAGFAPSTALTVVPQNTAPGALGTVLPGSGLGLGVLAAGGQFAVAVDRVDADDANYGSAHFGRPGSAVLAVSSAATKFTVVLEGPGTLLPDGVRYDVATAPASAWQAFTLALDVPAASATRLLKPTGSAPAAQQAAVGPAGLIVAFGTSEVSRTDPFYDSLLSLGAQDASGRRASLGLRAQVGTPYTSRVQRSSFFNEYTRTDQVASECTWAPGGDAGVTVTWSPNSSRAVEYFLWTLGGR